MDVIVMSLHVSFISDGVLPKPILPDNQIWLGKVFSDGLCDSLF